MTGGGHTESCYPREDQNSTEDQRQLFLLLSTNTWSHIIILSTNTKKKNVYFLIIKDFLLIKYTEKDCKDYNLIKSLLCTNVLNDVTAAPFLVFSSQLPAVKKH